MATVLIVGNFLEPEYFGIYTALYVVVSMLSEVSDVGFKNIIIRENSDDSRTQKLLFVSLLNSVIMFLFYQLFIFFYSKYSIEQTLWYQQLFGILIILLTMNNYNTTVFKKRTQIQIGRFNKSLV